jgi:hypothetical protein
VLLRPIKEAGTLLPKLVEVDGMIIGPLLINSRAKVVWLLLRVIKKKRYRYPIKADLF